MSNVTAARRYAKGILELGKKTGALEVLLKDMQTVKSALHGTRELQHVLKSPVIRDDKKHSILTEVFRGKVSEVTLRLLDVLKSKSRFSILLAISEAFEDQYNEFAGIIEVTVSSAFELDKASVEKLIAAMEKSTGKKVKASVKTDTNLIGGVAVKFNDTVIDGSVRNRLERMTDLMTI